MVTALTMIWNNQPKVTPRQRGSAKAISVINVSRNKVARD